MTAEDNLQERFLRRPAAHEGSPYESADVPRQTIINWSSVIDACGDEDTVNKIIKIFLSDARQCVELIAEAINTGHQKNLKLYAHRLKGAAGQIAVEKLSQTAYRLECAADEEDFRCGLYLRRLKR